MDESWVQILVGFLAVLGGGTFIVSRTRRENTSDTTTHQSGNTAGGDIAGRDISRGDEAGGSINKSGDHAGRDVDKPTDD